MMAEIAAEKSEPEPVGEKVVLIKLTQNYLTKMLKPEADSRLAICFN